MAAEPRRPEPAHERCLREIGRLTQLGDHQNLSSPERPAVLLSAKAEPVVFVRAPLPAAQRTPVARALAERFETTKYPWDVLRRQLGSFAEEPELGRQVLLREHYLFHQRPDHAFALVDLVQPHHLYRTPNIWVQRGELVLRARRTRTGRYVLSEGPDAGRALRLLLFDRVGTGDLPPPLHRDLRSLRYRLHFERARLRYADGARVVADLEYDGRWVPSLLRSSGARLELDCEAVAVDQLRRVREEARRRARLVQALRAAIIDQIHEGMFFDEPLTELGQEDGRLRSNWRFAYLEGRRTYRFNADRYPVFNAQGRPIPPQVCVDFLLDTLSRASGTWWFGEDEPRGRSVGALDWDEWGTFALRSASRFIELVELDQDKFEVMRPGASDTFGIGSLARLTRYLEAHPADYQPGDMVLIFGRTPWDRHERHYHSFFVYETDPVSGMPMTIAGNAGRPALRTWRAEARRTPEREILLRARPKTAWLGQVIAADAPRAAEPPPLSVEVVGPLAWPIPGRR